LFLPLPSAKTALIALNVVGAITGVVSIGMMIPGLIPEKDDKSRLVLVAK